MRIENQELYAIRPLNINETINNEDYPMLLFISQYIFNNGFPASIREITLAMNLSSESMTSRHLNDLLEKEWITKEKKRGRTTQTNQEKLIFYYRKISS